ncbi:Hydroxysteroid 17-beta dehydrogenase 11 [Handroanthus impetiginosus]|uniref:Hydroxysteroid 17-beta dehydrogenase 11 n=1 Tax=Handroanthus impetiginosus TaxID=429701 RepID=A0A2G9HAL5_9LAMI|nr:Hydroxysteroid 17-beta dehydrogenase 11 [Handroanthus impetiginosus]
MDLVDGFLNIFAPFFTIITFSFFFPGYLLFKSLQYVWRSIFSENLAGKVVIIAGASSGIGEHLAYEYGKRGAFLVIGARREKALQEVAERACLLGSPRAIPLRTDISKVEDCKRLIEEAINQFGRLDHLVMSAGVTPVSLFEDTFEVTNFAPAMRNGSGPRYARCKTPTSDPQLNTIYNYHVLSVKDHNTKNKMIPETKNLQICQVVMTAVPIELVGRSAKAIVNSACRGDKYLTVPSWFRTTFFIKMLCPEATDWFNRWFLITEPGIPPTEAISKKIIDLPGLKDILWPDTVRSPNIKSN